MFTEGLYSDTHSPLRLVYIPPEYLLGKRPRFAGDIWAFGVTMLYVLGLMPKAQER